MYNNNGRPLTRRQTVRVMVLLTLLAWATQTLFRQWAHGQDLSGVAVDVPANTQFVPSSFAGGAIVELRSDATIMGGDVTLKQIARWNNADNATLAPMADLVVLRLSQNTPYKTITLDELRGLLTDAGVNMAAVRLSGATRCTVARSDVHFNEGDALQKWLDARDPKAAADAKTPVAAAPADSAPTIAVVPAPADRKTNPDPIKTLRTLIGEDYASRISLPVDTLQLSFNAKDDRLLNLPEGTFRFTLEPVRAKELGSSTYDITVTNNGNSQKTTISFQARAWQQQVVVMKPLAFKQLITTGDVQSRKTLIDHLNTDPMVTIEQAVGMLAARDLKPGTVITARLIDSAPLVHTGQLVTVSFVTGTVQLRSVARAMQGGTLGQTIQVKNETTGAIFEVSLTGPQTATMGGQEKPAADAVSAAQ